MRTVILQIPLIFLLVNADPLNLPQNLSGEPITLNSTIGSEYGDKFQGDMIFPPGQNEEGRGGRTGLIDTRYRWPKSNGLVLVACTFGSSYTTAEYNTIIAAMTEIQSKTCIRFIQRTTEANYIRIVNNNGCWSYVGKIGGMQDLSLDRNGCVYFGTAMHELMHALGFDHMHSHADRDQKIKINWENIQDSYKYAFDKVNPYYYSNFGTPFDITSIMHYGAYAFSKNGQMTIQAYSSNDQTLMGQRSYLSAGDIIRIKAMYQC